MNLKEVEKTVARIKGSLFKNSNSVSIGMLKSKFRGTGLQFREHQIYTPGDDVRFIDWKIVAKTGNPYIKTFEEDRNVEIVVIIDTSESMLMGYDSVSKLQAAIELCCLLYLIAKESGDFVHAIIAGETVVSLPRANGEKGIVSLIAALERDGVLGDDGRVNLGREVTHTCSEKEKISIITKHLERRREVVLFSDFNSFLNEESLRRLMLRSHVHCFHLTTPLEEGESVPYAVYTKQRTDSDKSHASLSRIYFQNKDTIHEMLKGRYKKLNVKDRYLENFIEDMV